MLPHESVCKGKEMDISHWIFPKQHLILRWRKKNSSGENLAKLRQNRILYCFHSTLQWSQKLLQKAASVVKIDEKQIF